MMREPQDMKRPSPLVNIHIPIRQALNREATVKDKKLQIKIRLNLLATTKIIEK